MTEQITIEEALEIVSFERDSSGKWEVYYVKGTVFGNVLGDVRGNILGTVFGTVRGDVGGNVGGTVLGDVRGDVRGDVGGNVGGTVKGKIHSDEWKRAETPHQKLKRLIESDANKEQLLEALNNLEDN